MMTMRFDNYLLKFLDLPLAYSCQNIHHWPTNLDLPNEQLDNISKVGFPQISST